VVAIKKKPKGTNFSDHRTVFLFANTPKAIVRILRRRFKRKLWMRLEIISVDTEEGEQLGMQFGCRE